MPAQPADSSSPDTGIPAVEEPDSTGAEPDGTGAEPGSRAGGKVQALSDRYSQTRERLDRSVAGHVQRRVKDIDLSNQALILAALAFMLLIPVLVSLSALFPLGAGQGIAAEIAQRLGLSPEATQNLQALFPSRDKVLGTTTFFSVALAFISAFSWPTALQRGYELAWGLPSLGWRALWRPLLWLAGFLVFGAVLGGAGPLVTGGLRVVLLVVIGLPLATAWAWWTQHLLLGGRVGWRQLLPGAIAIGVGLVAIRLFAEFYLSSSIISHYQKYGPLGIVFIMLSWLVALSTVMLGGAVLGVVVQERRQERRERRDSAPATDQPSDDSGS